MPRLNATSPSTTSALKFGPSGARRPLRTIAFGRSRIDSLIVSFVQPTCVPPSLSTCAASRVSGVKNGAP